MEKQIRNPGAPCGSEGTDRLRDPGAPCGSDDNCAAEDKKIAVIPAYEPDEKLTALVREAKQSGFEIIVVDDGSGERYRQVFDSVKKDAELISYPENRGKGYALKAAFARIRALGETGVVVVLDCDGQHTVKDAVRLCGMVRQHPQALHLGRRVLRADAPRRSRFGNRVTAAVFRLATGCTIHDTQTGMRAFSTALLDRMLEIEGNRYEYEMNMLMTFAREKQPVLETEIATIYIDNNKGSHFRTVRDSLRIYRDILKFAGASVLSFLLDYTLYGLFFWVTGGQAVLSNITARVFSAVFNFQLNRRYVFQSRESVRESAVKYGLLAVSILVLNSCLLQIQISVFSFNGMLAKLLTEGILFLGSYFIQKNLVFRLRNVPLSKA